MYWVYFVLLVLLVLSPAILYAFALVAAALASTYYRRLCSACGRRGLKSVNFIRATVVVNGRRAPDFWSYYICELCGSGFKLHRGELSGVTADEIQRNTGRSEQTAAAD